MALQDSVKSLMNPLVISVLPDTLILTAVDILLSNNFNGIPVVDKSGVIVGILTKYDLIVKRSSIRDDMTVGDVMNKDPLVLADNMTVEDAITAFTEHHRVDPIPVLDPNKKVIGVISRYDMVKLFREYGVSFASNKDINSSQKKSVSLWPAIVLICFALATGILYYLGYFN